MALRLRDPVCTMVLQSSRDYGFLFHVRRGFAVGLNVFDLQSLGSCDHDPNGNNENHKIMRMWLPVHAPYLN